VSRENDRGHLDLAQGRIRRAHETYERYTLCDVEARALGLGPRVIDVLEREIQLGPKKDWGQGKMAVTTRMHFTFRNASASMPPLTAKPADTLQWAARGASIFKMMDVSRHRSVDTLRGYVRDAELFKDHAGAGLL
jgi:hypothetical protein